MRTVNCTIKKLKAKSSRKKQKNIITVQLKDHDTNCSLKLLLSTLNESD